MIYFGSKPATEHEAWWADGFWTGLWAGAGGTIVVLTVPFVLARFLS